MPEQRCYDWSSGFLPSVHQGVPFRSQGDPILNVSSPNGYDRRLQRASLDLIASLNREQFDSVNDPEINSRILAYETPSANPRLWNHGIAFCLPREVATMGQRTCITELGPDRDAILEPAREELLFDLGMGLHTADFCVRTSDPGLIDMLRSAVGRSWLAAGEVNQSIVKASPARVVLSRLARIEVSNPIPPPGGVSPDGPHTHVLPDLIRRHRVHDASIPAPAGFLPCLTLYPAHPARDAEGRERPFDPAIHASYQQLLERHGDADYVAAKRSAQLDQQADSRSARLGRLIAARQRALIG